jgi:hypothetical protein
MTNKEAIEYGKKWNKAIESREARQFLSRAIKALEWQLEKQYGDCDYCKYKNHEPSDYPCIACDSSYGNYQEMWEEAEDDT